MTLTDSLLERCRPLLRLQVRRLQLDARLKRRFDSSDLVQETLTRAVSRLDQFRGANEGELIRWLQRILRTVALNAVEEAGAQARDYERERPLQEIVTDSSARIECFLAAPTPTPADEVARVELLLRLAEAIEQLPEDQRDAVGLRYLHGYRVEEIAGLLEKTEKAVAGLLLRGRTALREFARALDPLPP
jgi:RNA polymerase sigma-70 factor (ECF subfamily)